MSAPAPTAALRAVIPRIEAAIPPSRIDQLWLFPPRIIGEREMGLVVMSLFSVGEDRSADRDVFTLEYQAELARPIPPTETLTEQGRAPADRIHRIIDGVLARTGEEGSDPDVHKIEGSEDRWRALLADLGVPPLDPANG
ncbi:MAG TPA: hypothetical protein VFI91_07985 [Longimicrobiaceae bacterium]|nr:hypothetical protein [Longimicrobiaceae bacterium]